MFVLGRCKRHLIGIEYSLLTLQVAVTPGISNKQHLLHMLRFMDGSLKRAHMKHFMNSTKLASVHRRYPPWRASVYMRAMSLAHTSRRHFRRKVWPHEKLNPYHYRLKHGLSHGIGIARLATFLFEKNVPKVHAICRWHALSDAISDENFGRTKNLNPYYYRLNDGL